jgi:uncharacterized protein (TIGR02147 family)
MGGRMNRGSTSPEAPRIFEFKDYRSFLSAHFAFRKSRDPEFSLRVFARHPGLDLASSSFLSAVLKGRKNLSQSLRLRFGQALGLKPEEQEYFELLVQANQGKTADERIHYQSRLGRFHGPRARGLADSEHRFFGRWWYPVVWHWIGLHPDQGNPARIARAIRPRLEPAQAEEAIQALLDLKLIKRLANGYAVTERHLAGVAGVAGVAEAAEAAGRNGTQARAHARAYLRLILDKLEGQPAGAREDSGEDPGEFHVLSFTLSESGRERLREKLEALRAEVRELAAASDSAIAAMDGAAAGGRVYALGLQLFPCSESEAAEGVPAGMEVGPGTSAEIALLPT